MFTNRLKLEKEQGLLPPRVSPKEKLLDNDLARALKQARSWISPVWDVRDYVAVNPFWGHKSKHFLRALYQVQAATGEPVLPERKFFKTQFTKGQITLEDLSHALSKFKEEFDHEYPYDIEDLIDLIEDQSPQAHLKLLSLSDAYDRTYKTKMTELFVKQTSKWLSAYFDEGQSTLTMPDKACGLFHSWKNLVVYDLALQSYKLNLKSLVEGLSHEPQVALQQLTQRLCDFIQLNTQELTHYYYRLLCSVHGWASLLKKQEFEQERQGKDMPEPSDDPLLNLLVIRMCYDLLLLQNGPFYAMKPQLRLSQVIPSRFLNDYVWLLALEQSYRRQLKGTFLKAPVTSETKERPKAQMAFCIDVRSERMRRALEFFLPDVETLGFAGFFGMPISFQGLGHKGADQHCPVLLNSQFNIPEKAPATHAKKKQRALDKFKLHKWLKSSTHAGFSFVETLGWTYALKMLSHANGLKSPNLSPEQLGLKVSEIEKHQLDLSQLSLNTQVSLAASAIKGLGLTQFAPLVIFLGHGSTSANNPYASALDCGACAGHQGQVNAKLLSKILNDESVRENLAQEHHIHIPKDTIFLSGLHHTSLHKLEFDLSSESISETHRRLLKELQPGLEQAQDLCLLENSQTLGFTGHQPNKLKKWIQKKSQDWSEIRPEWGLAGNASFVIARRIRTRGQNLSGRAFLHDYDAEKDPDGSLLEQIMTAPMIVTHWINMQYYASTVSNSFFGSGNKVLHNVTGQIGCIAGNGSDLLVGLSEQSVHYQQQYVHHPLRLQVFIEADPGQISAIVDKHTLLKDLVHHQWLHLISMNPQNSEFKILTSDNWKNF